MKIFLLLIFGVALSEQYFWFQKTPEHPLPEEKKPEPQFTGEHDERYIINIVKFKVINGTEGPAEFGCLGTLIAEDFAVAPADCVKVLDPYRIGVQFVINSGNDIGPSIVLSRTEIIIHDNYTTAHNDTNNIALVKFFPQGISINPPIFDHFLPIQRGGLPHLNYCSMVGSDIHLSTPPKEDILINGPGCCGTGQPYCSVFPSPDHTSCNALHGAPVLCNRAFSGFLLSQKGTCVNTNGRYMMKFHSVEQFKDWINYWIDDTKHTTAPPPKAPNSGSIFKLSISLFIFAMTSIALK